MVGEQIKIKVNREEIEEVFKKIFFALNAEQPPEPVFSKPLEEERKTVNKGKKEKSNLWQSLFWWE